MIQNLKIRLALSESVLLLIQYFNSYALKINELLLVYIVLIKNFQSVF